MSQLQHDFESTDDDQDIRSPGSRSYIIFAIAFSAVVLAFAAVSIAVVTHTP